MVNGMILVRFIVVFGNMSTFFNNRGVFMEFIAAVMHDKFLVLVT